MDKETFDLCIIGGGINGAGIARDAAGRGYKVLMLEKGDLAQETSSASTKLIHGGLRYLEFFQFGLVKKALRERDVMLSIAPHIVSPMRFILPHVKSIRPFWMVRLGVWIYDLLAGKTRLQKSATTAIQNDFLKANFKKGIAYSDCWVDDARLVVLNAMDAMAHGAVIKTRTQCISITRDEDTWCVTDQNGSVYHAQMIVNAAGPWSNAIHDQIQSNHSDKTLRLIKGSHIVIPKLYDEDESYILQNTDGRIVFTIPYEQHYTLVGTTEIDMGGDPDKKATLDNDEKKYLKDVIKTYFQKSIRDVDIIHSYSGVRPLLEGESDSSSALSRDYDLSLSEKGSLPFLSVFGGKITTYRQLAEEAVDHIDCIFMKERSKKSWTANAALPGGDVEDGDIGRYIREQATAFPFLSQSLIRRYATSYGTCMEIILDGVKDIHDMGEGIAGGVYAREIDYLMAYEFAQTAEDVLWRRSKLGLHLGIDDQKAVAHYISARS